MRGLYVKFCLVAVFIYITTSFDPVIVNVPAFRYTMTHN